MKKVVMVATLGIIIAAALAGFSSVWLTGSAVADGCCPPPGCDTCGADCECDSLPPEQACEECEEHGCEMEDFCKVKLKKE